MRRDDTSKVTQALRNLGKLSAADAGWEKCVRSVRNLRNIGIIMQARARRFVELAALLIIYLGYLLQSVLNKIKLDT